MHKQARHSYQARMPWCKPDITTRRARSPALRRTDRRGNDIAQSIADVDTVRSGDGGNKGEYVLLALTCRCCLPADK